MTVHLSVSAPMPDISAKTRAMRHAAEDLEAAFLTEMLKPMGAGAPRETFGGGEGEDQFSSFLVEQEAKAMAHHGGIGLAEGIYRSMLDKTGGVDGD